MIVAVREELEYVTTEVRRTKLADHLESLWIVINNTRIKLRIGVVYFPQEQDQELKEIYEVLKKQVEESRERDESIIILGDFNCKVGEEIAGNNKKVSKCGRKLLKFIEKEGLVLANGSNYCHGKWTREENNVKSILDYVVVDKELDLHIKKMEIHDQDKDISPFHLKRVNAKKIRTIYSDHNPIMVETDLVLMQKEMMEKRKKAVLTKEGREKYHNDLQRKEISKVWNNPDKSVQEMYDEWEKLVIETRKDNETIRKTNSKRKSKTMRLLMKEKKKLKEEMKTEEGEKDMTYLNELKEKIITEEQESYYRKLKKNCEEIRKDGKFNSGGFWKLKKRMNRKKEGIHAIEDKDGKLLTENNEIINRYGEYYEELLTTTNKKTKLPENQETVRKVEEKFEKMMAEARKQPAKKTEEGLVEKVVKGIKTGKARDSKDWNNEMIKDGGPEMKLSIQKMADTVKERYEVPNQWNSMMVRSIDKKGRREDMQNKRGLFLTNIVSKVFEKIQDQESEIEYDPFQNGGQRGRGTVDNWMIVHAVIDEGKRLKKPVYFFFGDLVKCFDRLWLKDCVVDMYESGMRARDAGMVYKLNEKAEFKVITPAGVTDEISVSEIVKQGTVFGPKLCCASTGKINEGLEEREMIFPTVGVQAATFVDDINGGGSKRFVQAVMMSCSEKEMEKLWEFSIDKTKWMCVKNRKKNTENIEVRIKQGVVGQVKTYKLLGNYVNEKGNMDDQLQHMETKAIILIREANKLCCQYKVGISEFEAKNLVFHATITTAIFYNIETWTNLRNSDWEKMEVIQGKILKGLYGLPKSTPYWGLLSELNILPIKLLLLYRKLMLYHSIMNSDDRRVVKNLIRAQAKSGHRECWYGNVREEGKEIGIEVSEGEVSGVKKSTWKKKVKKKIKDTFEKEKENKKGSSRKMRFLQGKGDIYLTELHNDDARLAMMIRLNMVSWIEDNFGQESSCPLCTGEIDTTEHVFECSGTINEAGVTVKNLEDGENE